jgi:GT2 family glycosyltransferase
VGEVANRSAGAEIGVALLSYHRPGMTRRAVEGLYAHTEAPFRLLTVDNGSDAGTKEALLELHARGLTNLALLDENVGWVAAKNLGVRWLLDEGFPWCVLLENDGIARSVDPQWPCWLRQHVAALERSGLPVLQVRPPLHGERDPNAVDLVRVERFGFGWRLHDEVWSKCLVMPRATLLAIGGFFPGYSGGHGAYADVDWGDRVLRWSQERTTLPLAAGLGERHVRYAELADEQYPHEPEAREGARWGAHRALFRERRAWIWDDRHPDLHQPVPALPAPDAS